MGKSDRITPGLRAAPEAPGGGVVVVESGQSEPAELELIYRTAPVGLCVMDRALRFVRINERLAEINGKPVAAHIGRTLREVIPDIAPKVEPIYRRVFESGQPILNVEAQGETPAKPGEQRVWLANYLPLKSPDGLVQAVSVVVEEITERKRAEESLRQAHDDLEAAVHRRTAELQASNESLRHEIAERERAEQARPESEERFRSVFENAAAGMATISPGGRFARVNRAFAQFLGYTQEELLALRAQDVTHPEDRPTTLAALEELKSGQRVVLDLEKRYLRKDGATVWGHVTATRLPGGDSGPDRYVALVQDITQRKNAERALRDSDERFRQLAENIREVFWITSPDYEEMIYISPAYEIIWGRTCESLYERPRSWLEVIHPDDRDAVMAADTRQGELDLEYRIVRPDGSIRWIRDRAFPIRDETGQIYRLAGIAEDITERKRAEQGLRESEERFRKIFEEGPLGMAVVASDYRLLKVNSTFCRMLRYTEKELTALTFPEITHPEDVQTDVALAQKVFKGEIPFYQIDKRYIRKDGQTVWASLTASVFRGDDGSPLYGLAMITDITKRKQTEQQLAFQAQLLDSVQESVVATDLEGQVIYWGKGAERLYGYSPNEVLGKPITFIVKPQEEAEEINRMRQVCETGAWSGQYIQQRKDGTSFWADTSVSLVRDAGGSPCGSIGIDRDITKHKFADEALRLVVEGTSASLGEDFFSSLVRHLAAAFNVRVAFVSELHPTIKKRLHLLALWDATDFVEPFEYDPTGTPCEKVFAEEIAYYPSDVQRAFPKDVWLRENGIESYLAVPLYDQAGNPIGHLGVMDADSMRDDLPRKSILRIFAARAGAELERKQAEEAQREDEQQFRQIAENASEIFFLSDARDNSAIYVSPAYEEIFGHPVEELYVNAQSWLEAVHPDDRERVNEVLEKHGRGRQAFSNDYRIVRPDGSIRWLHDRVFPVRNESGEIYRVVGICEDITERKRTEDRARHLEADLAHVGRISSLGEMAAALAHELNQPLAAIANYAEGCLDMLKSKRASQRELTEAMEQVSQLTHRAGKIIQRIRSLARKGEPHRSPVHINDLVREVAGLIEPKARAEGVTVKLELGDGLPMIFADSIQIQQVLLNLVQNALDAMKETQRERQLTIRTASPAAETVEVEVRDTGSGLAPSDAERIFEPFFTTKKHGLGMGLTISRSIIEAHHARLWAESAAQGAAFRFRLPYDATEPGDEG